MTADQNASALAKRMWEKLSPQERSKRQSLAALKGWETKRKGSKKKSK